MKYLLLVYGTEHDWHGSDREECLQESAQFARQLQEAGHHLGSNALQPVSTAISVRVRDGRRLVTDGPFAETQEQLAGYYLIEAPDLDEALRIAARVPGARGGTVEVRPVLELGGVSPLLGGPGQPGQGFVSLKTQCCKRKIAITRLSGEPAMKDTAERTAKLQVTLPSDRELLLTRTFDAPRELVFEAYTKPEHLRHWWGPGALTMTTCEMDFRSDGQYRFVLQSGEGGEYGFRGEYREIVPPERIVQTFEFEGAPGHVALETLALEEHDGKTTLRGLVCHASKAARDGHLHAGMEEGAAETYDRLAEYLLVLAASR